MVIEFDVRTGDGRVLHGYEHGAGDTAVVWFHGTPNIGAPPVPLFAAAERLGLRFVSYDRPGYGGSTAQPGRTIAAAAGDVAAVADARGLGSFAVLGHSGGGPHALAAAALLGGRVTAAVSISGLAPRPVEADGEARRDGRLDGDGEVSEGNEAHEPARDGNGGGSAAGRTGRDRDAREPEVGGFDWFAGMGPAGTAGLRAALAGRRAKEAHQATEHMPDFLPADWAALEGPWGWFGSVVEAAVAAGDGPLIDDDLAYVAPWGFEPGLIGVPVLLVHGGADLVVPAAHSAWLGRRIPGAEVLIVPGEGHVSVLPVAAERAVEWIARRGKRAD